MQLDPQIESHGFLGMRSTQTFALRKDNVGYVLYVTKVIGMYVLRLKYEHTS